MVHPRSPIPHTVGRKALERAARRARRAAARKAHQALATSTSNPSYVHFGQPVGWPAMAKVVREFDEEKVQEFNRDMDALLVFVSTTVSFISSVSDV